MVIATGILKRLFNRGMALLEASYIKISSDDTITLEDMSNRAVAIPPKSDTNHPSTTTGKLKRFFNRILGSPLKSDENNVSLKWLFDHVLAIPLPTDTTEACNVNLLRASVEYAFVVIELDKNLNTISNNEARVKEGISQSIMVIENYCNDDIGKYVITKLKGIRKMSLKKIHKEALGFYANVPADLIVIWEYFANQKAPDLGDPDAEIKLENILAEKMVFAMEDYHRYLYGCEDEEYCPKINWDELVSIAKGILRNLNGIKCSVKLVVALSRLVYGSKEAVNFLAAEMAFKNHPELVNRNYRTLQSLDDMYIDILRKGGFGFKSDLGKPPKRDRILLSYSRQTLEKLHRNLQQCRIDHDIQPMEPTDCFELHVTIAVHDFALEIHRENEDNDIPMFLHIELLFRRNMEFNGGKRTAALVGFSTAYIYYEVRFVEYYIAMQTFEGDDELVTLIHKEILPFLNEEMKSADLSQVETMPDFLERFIIVQRICNRLQDKFDYFEKRFFLLLMPGIFYRAFYLFLKHLRAKPNDFIDGLLQLRQHIYPVDPFVD